MRLGLLLITIGQNYFYLNINTNNMKIIITESQKNFLWLLRRLEEPDMIDHMMDIIVEGFDYIDVCEYVSDTAGFIDTIIHGSVETFINSYSDKFEGNQGTDELYRTIYNFMEKKFKRTIFKEYQDKLEYEECED